MLNECFFSIIMPVYNSEKFINNTLKSILSQRFQDYELILINDGSSDRTAEICQSWCIEDERIKLFHKKNGGICDARNHGMLRAKGKYIVFCDHDDIFLENLLEICYENLKSSNLDILKFSYVTKVLKDNKVTREYETKANNSSYKNISEIKCYETINLFSYTVWNGIYKREFLNSTKVCFDTSIKFGMEDVVFNLNLLKYSFNLKVIDSVLYLHFIKYGQSTSRKFDVNKLESIKKSLIIEQKLLLNNLDVENRIKLMAKYIRSYFVSLSLYKNEKHSKNKYILEFNDAILFNIQWRYLFKYFFKIKTDCIKVALFKLHFYSFLFYLLRDQ